VTTPGCRSARRTINTAKAVVEPAPGGASAGHIGLQVTVTKGSSAACVLEGFPGVSLVTGTGGQELGAPAKRTPGTPASISLEPGAKVSAPLSLAQAVNFSDCGVTAAPGSGSTCPRTPPASSRSRRSRAAPTPPSSSWR
jgi:hypothetical protein